MNKEGKAKLCKVAIPLNLSLVTSQITIQTINMLIVGYKTWKSYAFFIQLVHGACVIDTTQTAIMNFHLTRNIHFTKLVKTIDRLREFNFRVIPGSSNSLLHVDVPDDRGNRIMFKMQREENTLWKVVGEELPTWITSSEKNLNDLIEEELQ